MEVIISPLLVAVETIVIVTLLALIAGFSPTLYLTQVSRASHTTRSRHDAQLLITGVASALVVLLLLFQFLHLDTLLHILGSTVSALAVSTLVNIVVGSICIYGGICYLNRQRDTSPLPSARSSSALIGFAFFRTILSVSGITATFLGANLIAEASPGIVIRIVLTCIFLVVAIMPFLAIMLAMSRQPATLRTIRAKVRLIGDKVPYQTIAGGGAIVVGTIVIILQVVR